MKKLGFLLLLLCAACKKYPDDKKIVHLKSPEKRLLNEWVLNAMTDLRTGGPIAMYAVDQITFRKDLEVIGRSYMMLKTQNSSLESGIGSFAFEDHYSKLVIVDSMRTGNTNIFTILQLDPKELKIRNDTAEFYFRKMK